jgi:UDP-glucose 4-epimerase
VFQAMKRILVTGGAGFIGSHLIKKIFKTYEVYVIDDLSNKKSHFNADMLKDSHIPVYEVDIRNKESIQQIVKDCRPHSCVHLAAKISVPDSIRYPYSTIDVNVTGTHNVVSACVSNSVKGFVFSSSAAVYGHAEHLPVAENTYLKPISTYGASKVAAEQIINAYGDLGLFESIITLRFFNVYGVGQSEEYAGVISKFKDYILRDLPPVIFGDGDQKRDFVSVHDVVDSIMMALKGPVEVAKGIFNIATGVPTTITDLAKIMATIAGKPRLLPIYNESLKGDIRLSYADTTNSETILKFKSKRDLMTGLQEFIKNQI